jgi:hypothetical protein
MPIRRSAAAVINLLAEENEPEQAREPERPCVTEQERQRTAEQERQHTAERERYHHAPVLEWANVYTCVHRRPWSGAEQEWQSAAAQEWENAAAHHVWCAALSERSRVSILLTQPLERPFLGPVSIPIPRQEWADTISAIIALDKVRSARIHRHDANGLVDWLFDLLGPPGAANDEAEQNTRHGLESTVADEISWAEIDIAIQQFRERIRRMDEGLYQFMLSQEFP